MYNHVTIRTFVHVQMLACINIAQEATLTDYSYDKVIDSPDAAFPTHVKNKKY